MEDLAVIGALNWTWSLLMLGDGRWSLKNRPAYATDILFASWSHNKWLVQKLDPLLLMLLLQMRHELLSKQVRNLIALGITNTFMPRCHHVENGEFPRFFRSRLSPTLWLRQAAGHHDIKNTTPFWNARSPRSYWSFGYNFAQFCSGKSSKNLRFSWDFCLAHPPSLEAPTAK